MNYEKKYKEALKRARMWRDKSGMPTDRQGILDDIFPELKESEDERIRTAIIHFISHTPTVPKGIIGKETMLAWLEKQGELKPIEIISAAESLGVSHEEYNKIVDECIFGEQKPNPCDGCINRKGCINCENGELRETEQRPTQEIEPFEAEHGKYYYCIKDYFCGGRKQASKGDVIQALRGLPIMGLKDASEYFLPVNFIKCNSAWSEEEERYICQLESMVKEEWRYAETAQDEEAIKKASDLLFFLKTLNPNKKPSDEEMKELLRTEYEKGRADAIAEIKDESEKELAGTYLAKFDEKFPVLPILKGKQLADYKDFLNACQQIFGLKYWGIRPLQAKLFEKLSLLWAAWGAEHL